MTDPSHDNIPDRFVSWLKSWGWIWLIVMIILFSTLWLVDKL